MYRRLSYSQHCRSQGNCQIWYHEKSCFSGFGTNIGNYFRNSAQKSDVLDFLKNRAARQNEAKEHIKRTLDEYNVKAVDTLIGDITPPAELMKTLTDRKLAEQATITYDTQKLAEDIRKQFESAKALANLQPQVVTSHQQVEIKKNLAAAKIEEAKGDSESKTINAKADAEVTTVTGEADAGKILAIGNAEAEVNKKTEAIGTKEFAQMQIVKFLAENKVKIVPENIGEWRRARRRRNAFGTNG